ncbi:MAG: Phosphoenolpyruvate synthase [Parcubacteria group bacterium GW2011_GWB1_43_8b]|nr:MAG: Phosphoenolpyruvate synthase [Parcubacteria group bacterium GW2011_GWB1_43_8b]
MSKYTKDLSSLTIKDVPEAGGKNASLGEMIRTLTPEGISVPGGFATTARAYRYFLRKSRVGKVSLEKFIKDTLKNLNTHNLRELQKKGKEVREAIKSAQVPKDLEREIRKEYRVMEKKYGKNVDVAVRSSATAEDLPGASFAGQQETYLNIRGEEDLIMAVRKCFASLFTDRAISYRQDKGFGHFRVALSVGIQKMIRSDKSCSGVLFTLDTESGFKDVVLINSSWGLGEMIVQGEVIPDEFLVFKPFLGKTVHGLPRIGRRMASDKNLRKSAIDQRQSAVLPIIGKTLGRKDRKMIYSSGAKPTKIVYTSENEKNKFTLNDEEILTLAKWGTAIEEHYTKKHKKWTPMDIEWAKDGISGELFIVQARPETVQAQKDFSVIREYKLQSSKPKTLVSGASVGNKIASGRARIILDVKGIHSFQKGEVLVTDMTDPDWEPVMKIASAIITDKGGRTSHAAIVSRELGIPCIVGSVNATKKIRTGQMITVNTTGSEGYVYEGAVKFKVTEQNIRKLPKIKTKVAVNVGTPETAFESSFLPVGGVGLAREEFILASGIGIHPMALVDYAKLRVESRKSKVKTKIVREIERKTVGYRDKTKFFVDQLAYGIAKIGAAFYPREVIVRFSDFKTNEYRQLVGGELYEPHEENPMIGWRGASRYYHPSFEKAFALEVKAIRKVREQMGLTNVSVMIPVCRTVDEGKRVLALLNKYGLKRESKVKSEKLKVYVMCEVPANVVLADQFLDIFDGMSIGSNDLTQMTLALDRDGNERIRNIANENNEAVKNLVSQVIKKCRARKKYIGICGDAPSTFPEFAKFLAKEGITSISLSPDAVIKTILALSKK